MLPLRWKNWGIQWNYNFHVGLSTILAVECSARMINWIKIALIASDPGGDSNWGHFSTLLLLLFTFAFQLRVRRKFRLLFRHQLGAFSRVIRAEKCAVNADTVSVHSGRIHLGDAIGFVQHFGSQHDTWKSIQRAANDRRRTEVKQSLEVVGIGSHFSSRSLPTDARCAPKTPH